jgi:hypothetical protein
MMDVPLERVVLRWGDFALLVAGIRLESKRNAIARTWRVPALPDASRSLPAYGSFLGEADVQMAQ